MRQVPTRPSLLAVGATMVLAAAFLLVPTGAGGVLDPPAPKYGDPDPWPTATDRTSYVELQVSGQTDGPAAMVSTSSLKTAPAEEASQVTETPRAWPAWLERVLPFWLRLMLWR